MTPQPPLKIPHWVPHPIAQLAHEEYARAIASPPEAFSAYATALCRVATDKRMREVWKEIYKKEGGNTNSSLYVHAARSDQIRACRQFKAVKHIEGAQNQAAVIIFLVSTTFQLWDRRRPIGPRVRTKSEIRERAKSFRNLAKGHEKDAKEYDRLGARQLAETLRTLAKKTSELAENSKLDPNSAWEVDRRSSRIGNDWERGFIIELTQECKAIFGKQLIGTVAALANVVLGRDDITKGSVQGVTTRRKTRPLT